MSTPRGGSAPGGQGVCSGGSAPEGGVCSGGVSTLGDLLWGMSAPGGCLLQGVSAPGGCLLRGVSAPRGVSALGGCLLPGGCLLLGGVSVPRGGGVCSWGVPGPRGCTWSGTPPCGQTHACKHITLPQTSFAGGKYVFSSLTFDCSVLVCPSIILLDFMGSYTF